jgi:hypothetical protein
LRGKKWVKAGECQLIRMVFTAATPLAETARNLCEQRKIPGKALPTPGSFSEDDKAAYIALRESRSNHYPHPGRHGGS